MIRLQFVVYIFSFPKSRTAEFTSGWTSAFIECFSFVLLTVVLSSFFHVSSIAYSQLLPFFFSCYCIWATDTVVFCKKK
jgi:hypothetical protein